MGAGNPFPPDAHAQRVRGDGGRDGARLGIDRSLVAELFDYSRQRRRRVLAYEIAPGDRVVHRRNFGATTDESEVITAEVSGDGMLNLRVFFPKLKQTREYGFAMQPDGTMRAMYNRNQNGEYTIRNGKFTANGNPTPSQQKCN